MFFLVLARYYFSMLIIMIYVTIHAFILHLFIQVPAFLLIKINPLVKDKELFHRLNAQALVAWGQVSVLLMRVFTPVEFILSGEPFFPQENAIVICNHLTYADWLWIWMLAHLNNRLAGIKIILKESPKFAPVFGTAMILFDFIFLKRKWEQDKTSMEFHLKNVKNKNLWLMVFPEGTILAKDTIEKSNEHCSKLKQEIPKLTLLPRTTGLQFIKDVVEYDAIYDITLAIPNIDYLKTKSYPYERYSLRNMFGYHDYPKNVYFHCRRIPKIDVPKNIDSWLYKIFLCKDKMIQDFQTTGELHHPDDLDSRIIRYRPEFVTFPLEMTALWCIMAMVIGLFMAINKS